MNLDKRKRRLNHGNSIVDDLLQNFNLKPCFVKLELIDGAMEPVVRKPGRPGRKPKASNAAAAGATATAVAATNTTAAAAAALSEAASTPDRKSPPVASEKSTAKKAAKNAEDLAVLSGGRGKRRPKPNPRYMNEVTLSSTKISIKDDSAESETNDDDMDEMLSSDDYRSPSDMPLKKRTLHQKMLQKATSSAKKQNSTGKLPPGVNLTRKTIVPAKRKLNNADIDIDDDHGKELFLAAKRRLTHVSHSFSFPFSVGVVDRRIAFPEFCLIRNGRHNLKNRFSLFSLNVKRFDAHMRMLTTSCECLFA